MKRLGQRFLQILLLEIRPYFSRGFLELVCPVEQGALTLAPISPFEDSMFIDFSAGPGQNLEANMHARTLDRGKLTGVLTAEFGPNRYPKHCYPAVPFAHLVWKGIGLHPTSRIQIMVQLMRYAAGSNILLVLLDL